MIVSVDRYVCMHIFILKKTYVHVRKFETYIKHKKCKSLLSAEVCMLLCMYGYIIYLSILSINPSSISVYHVSIIYLCIIYIYHLSISMYLSICLSSISDIKAEMIVSNHLNK